MLKTLFVTVCGLFVTMASFAQSNGDKLFMEGQKLQQVQTILSQNQAIKKFQSAKVVYTAADKKKMCDNQIAICKSNITSLKKGGSRKNEKTSQGTSTQAMGVQFSLSQSEVNFDGDKAGSAVVSINAPSLEWTFNLPEGIAGESKFVEVTRSNDAKSIEISASANPTTVSRSQTIVVTHESMAKKIVVKQNGKTVTLSTNTSLVGFGVKGGNKTIELYTNSDLKVPSNNNLTWSIESKPKWVEVSVEVKKKKGIVGKGLSAIKGLVEGKAEGAVNDDTKVSDVKIVASPLLMTDKEYEKGRRGEIVFASQGKKYKVLVVQQK